MHHSSSSSSSSGKSGIPSPLIFTGLLSTRMMSSGSVMGGRTAGTSSQICVRVILSAPGRSVDDHAEGDVTCLCPRAFLQTFLNPHA